LRRFLALFEAKPWENCAKTAAKTAAKTKSRAKSPKNSQAKRETVATLAQSLKSLETRLKGADTKNRNAIKSLESVVADIKAAAKRSSTTHKAALTRGLNQVELRLETYLERIATQARANIRSELSSVTAAGADLSTLETAVTSAHSRLDEMDRLHREALARLNRHVADLAVSIDNRLNSESQARVEGEAALDAKITSVRNHVDQRVDEVEKETANALEAVGAKVAEFAAVLDKRAESSDTETAERLADLAQDTKSGLTANEDDPRIDKMGETIASLQEELRRMHARIATVQHAPNETTRSAAPTASNILPMVTAPAPVPNLDQTQAQNLNQDNPYAAAAKALENSNAKAAASKKIMPAQIQTNSTRETHIPQEFDPAAFASQTMAPSPMPVVTQAPQISAPLPTLAQPAAYGAAAARKCGLT